MTSYLCSLDFLDDFHNGRKKAYDAFFAENWRRLHVFAMGIIRNPDLAEDIVIQSFAKLYIGGNKFPSMKAMTSFLYVMVRNAMLNEKRKTVCHTINDHEFDELVSTDHGLKNVEMEIEALQRAMYAALDRLPAESREVLKLMYFHEKSYKEIAEYLGISIHSVKHHRRYGLSKLKKFMPGKEVTSFG